MQTKLVGIKRDALSTPLLVLELINLIQMKNITSNRTQRRMFVPWLVIVSLIVCATKIKCNNITAAVFGNVLDGMPAAFGDFNSDELTDVFVLRNNCMTVEIFLGSDQEPLLNSDRNLSCTFLDRVTSVVPGDFDGDLFMDVMVTTGNVDDTKVWILWNNKYNLECPPRPTIERLQGQPLAMDYNIDMIVDLFGVNATSRERTFWIFDRSRTSPRAEVMATMPTEVMSNPHSNAFLDLNKDYAPDLVITRNSSYFEIWLNKTFGFEFAYGINFLPKESLDSRSRIGQMLFLDVELTGEMNLLLPVCFNDDPTRCTILMYSNTTGLHDLHVDFKQWSFPKVDQQLYTNTITLRSGDFNMDGYFDLLATLESNSMPNLRRSFILLNSKSDNGSSRTFKVDWDSLYPFHNETVMAVSYDFYQDGVLDVILVESKDRAREVYRTAAFKNSFDHDTNFVKVMVFTALNEPLSSWRKKKTPYVTNLPGPSIAYKMTTRDGNFRNATAAQLPQSAHFSLNLPYTTFGLDSTPNFIDVLTVGVGGNSKEWSKVIPNSQIVVIPNPINDPAHWKFWLFITPSKLILLSAAALMGVCCLISAIIVGLYWKERREDKKEKLQEAHRFHFDAM